MKSASQPFSVRSIHSRMPAADLSSLKIHDSARSSRSSGKFWGIFAAVIGLGVIVAGAVLALRGSTPVVEVAAARAPQGPGMQTLLNASGYVTPRRRATVAAKITGRVTGVFFDEGMHVKEGQLLATLDESDAKRALDSAKADRDASKAAIADLQVQLKYAEIELHRAQELHAEKVQSQEALDTARTNVDSYKAKIELAKQQVEAAEARVQQAQQGVDNCVITAPFAGIIVSKDAQVGEMVSPVSAGGGFTRTGIATIVDMNSNEIEVDVNEAYIARVQPHQKVMATLDAYPNWQIPSHVRTIIPTADRQKATVKVRISFDKLDPKILPDMGVKVAFLDEEDASKKSKEKDKAPEAKAIIPQSAVRTDGGNFYVFTIRDGRLERRAVNLGRQIGSDVEVVAGVSAGDSLVVKGPESLRDGQKVEIHQ
jgi:RND family efflux transporter MFP subunit